MKKNLLFTLIIPLVFSFCIIKPMQKQSKNDLKTLVSDITLAITVGIVSGELWAQLDNNQCEQAPSTRNVLGRLAIDMPLASVLNAYSTTNTRKTMFINSCYFISSTLSYYASPYIHETISLTL